MIEGMGAALSGLRAYINRTRATANNVANVNTPGFKASRVNLASMGEGRGVMTVSTQKSGAQGALIGGGGALDMAVAGAGYFKMRTPSGGQAYTRSGAFHLDSGGKLVDSGGNFVQGYKMTTDSAGNTVRAGAAGDIELGNAAGGPKETGSFRMGLNLDSRAAPGDTFTASFNVYNAEGEAAAVAYTFTKQAGANAWDFQAAGPQGTTVSGPAAAGTITFDGQGNMTSPASDLAGAISGFPSGAADLAVTWDIADGSGAPHGDITGYASKSAVTSITQDGHGAGTLAGFSVDSAGVVSGLFSNGATRPLYQLELSDFNNPGGLSALGAGLYGETAQSGQPITGGAGAGGFGVIHGGALEASNVDIAEQMVNLIQNKTGFSAQVKTIQTADEMLGSILDIKT
ncbi:MAG: flagellar hook protein FlgE [Candidatus Nitrospinota bacterium M3_3B_026]